MEANTIITKSEKQLVKGLILLYMEKGYDINDIDVNKLVIIMMKLTGINQREKRAILQKYITKELIKIVNTNFEDGEYG